MMPYIIAVVELPPPPRTRRLTAEHDDARADATANWSNLIM